MLSRSCLRQLVAVRWSHEASASGASSFSLVHSLPQKPSSRRRSLSTRPSSSDSIFSKRESAWEHVFSDVQDRPSPYTASQSHRGPQQSMTARESSAFNEMFEMIFDAVTAQESGTTSVSSSDSAVGVGRGGINDLIGKLRKHPRRLKWFSDSDEILDRQKEAMDLCTTDHELLEWATREVFGESQRYENEARKAISAAAVSGTLGDLPMLQPPTYPHLVALLMRAFRDKYNDPHLALSIFDHARHLSIASYVFGCSTQAYNELIETRWKSFRDLKGVHDGLEEMKVNGVKVDSRTRKIVEEVRREVGGQHLWVEESELGSGEIWNLLAKIEQLVAKTPTKASVPTATQQPTKWDVWKTTNLEDAEGDEWGFDRWETPDKRSSPRRTVSNDRRRSSSFGLKA
ncbi:hypothetical protein Hypma_008012 [Hypsizygus marmoreus]|uniref:Mtf2-like C-terminal domain-containing protein n=1 Tax=Hypsizygus marmoreus TaxID=39966 RepID=A0A369JTA0_HYPMA|nr:hypothetical protein Hypma_008012 [Hypsizygus marmoreus]